MSYANKLKDVLHKYIEDENGCWVWQAGLTPKGYGTMRWSGSNHMAHRLSWMHHNGPIPNGLFVLHHCDNPPCINPEHLWLGTHNDNAQDRVAKERSFIGAGSDNKHAILNEIQVLEIRKSLKAGVTCAELATKYMVSWPTIKLIKIGKTWSHI